MAAFMRRWICTLIVCNAICFVASQEGSGNDSTLPDQEKETTTVADIWFDDFEQSNTSSVVQNDTGTDKPGGKSTLQDVCKSDPCHNDGECRTVSVPTFACDCKNGYTGRQCDTFVDPRATKHFCVPSPCANGGTCRLSIDRSQFTCTCAPGFTGRTCQLNIGGGGGGTIKTSPCNPNPCPDGNSCEILPGISTPLCTPIGNPCVQNQCKNGATCSPRVGGVGYQCTCAAGYSGTYCENGGIKLTACNPNPCQNGGGCSLNTITHTATCTCVGEFSGPRCTQRRFLPDPCSPSPCNHGTCRVAFGQAQCQCHSGWSGANCNIPTDPCNPNPCIPYGSCIPSGQTYTCRCNGGFTGPTCKIPPNPCLRNPCLNGGGCTPRGNAVFCVCVNGYTGQRCEIAPNPCAVNQCLNGGGCLPSGSTFTCNCINGYTGQRCEIPPNPCARNPCLNSGGCSPSGNSYRCTCVGGFTGQWCEIPSNPCARNPCLNGGGCSPSGNSYRCTCVGGFTGQRCEIAPNPCTRNPCLNGGGCSPLGNSFRCTCINGYSGQRCEIAPNPCTRNPCLNGGGCSPSGNSFICTCVNGYTGQRCETAPNPCVRNPCLNGGRCTPLSGSSFSCSCINGYSGNICQLAPKNLCSPNPCQNNGVCTPSSTVQSSFICICTGGYSGFTCNVPPPPKSPCDPNPCKNSATCIVNGRIYACFCKPGYAGVHCEYPPNKCAPNPCLNQGTCQNVGSTYKCACTAGWQGPKCETPLSKFGVCDPNPCHGDCLCSPSCRHAKGYYCKGNTGYLGKNCTIAPPVITCGANTITISINPAIVNEYDGGKGGFVMFMAQSHSMKSASTCPARLLGGKYTFSLQLPFASCGTRVVSGVDGKTDVSNSIWINKLLANGLADMPVPIIHFVCKYEKQYSIVASLRPSLNVAPTIVSRGAKSNPANIELCKSGSTCPNKCQLPYSLTNGAFYTVGEIIHLLFTTTVQGSQFRLYDLFLSCAPDISATPTTAPVVLMSAGCMPVGTAKYLPMTARPFGSAICASFQVPKLTGCSQFYIHAKLQPCATNCLAPYAPCPNRGKRSELAVVGENLEKKHKIQVYGPIYTINGRNGVVTQIMYPGKEYINGTGTGILVIKDDPVELEDPPASNIPLHVALGILLFMAVIIFSVLVGHNWHYINAHCGRKF